MSAIIARGELVEQRRRRLHLAAVGRISSDSIDVFLERREPHRRGRAQARRARLLRRAEKLGSVRVDELAASKTAGGKMRITLDVADAK